MDPNTAFTAQKLQANTRKYISKFWSPKAPYRPAAATEPKQPAMVSTKSSSAGKAASKPEKKTKSKSSTVGAPSQHTQASRKGKRAWRKNVNIEEVEQGLEEIRAEERVIGTALHKTQDDQLFQIDVTGDDKIRKSLPRFSTSQLTSTKILAQRSAVPAVFSRTTSASSGKRKSLVSYEEKERLLRIGKRPRKGPFNSIVDPTELGAGSAILELSEAVKASGTYDAWAEPEPEEELKDGMETVQPKKYKPPQSQHPRELIEVPAIVEPHQGTSYNPPAEAHQALLMQAVEAEKQRIREAETMAEVKEKMERAKVVQEVVDETTAPGMTIDDVSREEPEEEQMDEEELPKKKLVERKTKSQRNKMAKLLAEKRALEERAARKRLHASISHAKLWRKSTAQFMTQREQEQEKRQQAMLENLKKRGLAGQRYGKHKVPEGQVEVQLGEDLSESLRGLKPEGNLFRDRFLSLQQRALIEPRVPVLPKKRRNRIIEYEKHAWKRFDRE